ncbi:aspartate 1-decarboxylase [Candidatus Nitrotoga sp. 1052]|uniref:aspartate 1-decarboxylase n=1 Tax=Candidatus Nitrotoga sp. 1052 TaxID=2886964 RepID=UPI001EF60E4E
MSTPLSEPESRAVLLCHEGWTAIDCWSKPKGSEPWRLIRAQRGSGVISVNGAAAHKANPGDILIIATYAMYTELELQKFHPQLVYVDERNRIIAQRDKISVQAA